MFCFLNILGQYGYVPAAYLQELPSQNASGESAAYASHGPSMGTSMNSTESVSEQEKAAMLTGSSPPEGNNSSSNFSPRQAINSTSSVDEFSQQDLPMPPPPPPPPTSGDEGVYVCAIYDYVATNDEEISFVAGEMIKILDSSTDDGWWTGENKAGAVGHFPSVLVTGEEDEDEDEEEDDEEDEEDEESNAAALPNLPALPGALPPPPAPPSIVPPLPAAPLPPPPPPAVIAPSDLAASPDDSEDGCANFAPPPPPPPAAMTLMAPQMGVIIQPTPEIESKPMIGSEEGEALAENPSSPYDNEVVNFEEMLAQESEGTSASTALQSVAKESNGNESAAATCMAMAVQEVSETVTQQAMDDSMREISRRASTASSFDGSVVDAGASMLSEQQAANTSTSQTTSTLHNQPNGDILTGNGGELHFNEEDEDCK